MRRIRHPTSFFCCTRLSVFAFALAVFSVPAASKECTTDPVRALELSCLLVNNPSLKVAFENNRGGALKIVEEIRRRYQEQPGNVRARGVPLPEEFRSTPVLEPIYRTDPEAALDLLRRIRDASGPPRR